jgi:hypothetical protein
MNGFSGVEISIIEKIVDLLVFLCYIVYDQLPLGGD